MGLFSFVFYKEYYYFLIYWCMDLLLYIPSLKLLNTNKNNNESLVTYDYLHLLSLNFADLLSGFLVLITSYRMKPEKKPEKEIVTKKNMNQNSSIELIYNDFKEKDNRYILILILSIIELFARSSNLLFNLINDYKNKQLNYYNSEWIISLDIISRIIFSKIILKTRLYKHHLLSVLIFLFASLIMVILGITSIINENLMINILFLVPRNIIFGIGDIISKILLTYKFVLPQNLLFTKGVFNFGMHLFIFPILCLTNKFDKDIFSKYLVILFAILKIFFFFIRGFCIMKIIDRFSPLHVAFVNVVLCLYQYILFMIFDEKNKKVIYIFIINLICLIIIIFSTLLFNEIIIINAFGLNKYTKKNILIRAKKDNDSENSDSDSRNNSMLSDGIFDKEENLEN